MTSTVTPDFASRSANAPSSAPPVTNPAYARHVHRPRLENQQAKAATRRRSSMAWDSRLAAWALALVVGGFTLLIVTDLWLAPQVAAAPWQLRGMELVLYVLNGGSLLVMAVGVGCLVNTIPAGRFGRLSGRWIWIALMLVLVIGAIWFGPLYASLVVHRQLDQVGSTYVFSWPKLFSDLVVGPILGR